ncbi:MAG: Deoxycytidine triphosphate deaminase [Candidatus Beckwithbacteria bacterium GW2011_GWB1_47_15]|uniref:dCTP deaminase n=1 Tax=Candidatus Beckwithbacteria bacterium GW2011_GWB1_47_15 TaxID=1618371 RepID=A0A0G1RVL3_9BACT|nr:MAG: deoxycytidine triphosphate deaminase, dCTP deaminase [Candidatus Beckwithbacteria bacterium GW2011_GWC1_49_16]KKU35487.1 MAG: Deoxycytidine triphosphate deaminase [Candidatus Beckwithbacteria bacterium GW2011_GWA1_46_30]KKU61162.1 MAG: Deoxycytidine triphosphate deaminase [Candidatus Beckwithbacteria bacterium GW2011_GWB1_47_15]KKU72001.1 MAG: Deoxycytidine triphosphate deaminase [Candidatus Beckwithbacteria bacterium GW2011_GWA2_47_25]KKW03239.1 MAG: Deoxycytidine triphosphate deaminas
MILADGDIKKALASGRIKITPAPDLTTQLGSCSIDLRLGNKFAVFNHSKKAFIDPNDPKMARELMEEVVVKKDEQFILQPGDFVLATTVESFKLPDDLLARLEGRSSLGRLGVVVHSTASVFEPGWEGVVVMELGNLGRMPVALYPGMRVCALTFEQLTHEAEVPYYKKKTAKYRKQKTPMPSKIAEEKE